MQPFACCFHLPDAPDWTTIVDQAKMAPARKRKSTRSQDAETSRKLPRTSTSGTISRSKAKAEPADGDNSTAAIPISTAQLIATTRKVLASIDPHASPFHPRHRPDDHKLEGGDAETKEEIIQSSLSLAAFKAEMLAKSSSSDQTARSTRRRSSSGAPVELDLKGNTAEIDWQMYRDWPEGIAEEEAAMKVGRTCRGFRWDDRVTEAANFNRHTSNASSSSTLNRPLSSPFSMTVAKTSRMAKRASCTVKRRSRH